MREIEVKARIDSIEKVIAKLEKEGVRVSEPVRQRDEVFGLPGDDGMGVNTNPWLRIRTETSGDSTKYIYTLKKSLTNQLDSIEHETEVDDPDELRKIILHSGFEPYSDITKSRRKTKIGDMDVCIDSVDRLGEFIEVEQMTEEEVDYDKVVSELWKVMERFGASRSDEVTEGYDTMMKRLGV